MKTFLVFALTLSTIFAEESSPTSLSRLPVGANLTKVNIPRFDKNRKRSSLLTAEKMTVESEQNFVGKSLVIRLFDSQEEVSTTATLASARYSLETEQVIAKGNLLLRGPENRFVTLSQGGIFHLPSKQGLFLGPVRTMIVPKKKKKDTAAMNHQHLLAPILFSLPLLSAAPPPEITPEQIIEFERLVAPKIIPPNTAAENFSEAEKLNKPLYDKMISYLQLVGQTHLLSQTQSPKQNTETPEEQPLPEPIPDPEIEKLFKPAEDRIVLDYEQGYFDGENNEMICLGKIVLKAEGMLIRCDQDMKVIFEEPEEKAKAENDEDGLNIKGIGELKQITANGNIVLLGRDPKGNPIEVRAGRALYNHATEEITLRGEGILLRQGPNISKPHPGTNPSIVITQKGKAIIVNQSKTGWSTTIDARALKKNR